MKTSSALRRVSTLKGCSSTLRPIEEAQSTRNPCVTPWRMASVRGGNISFPFLAMNRLEDVHSRTSPVSVTKTASSNPRRRASCFASTLGKRVIALTQHFAQRVSSVVITLAPRSLSPSGSDGNGLKVMTTVGVIFSGTT